MCSLCGILGGQKNTHWTETASNPQVFESRSERHTWHRERQERTRLVNRILQYYGLSLSDWSGNSYLLRSRTGKTAILNNLSELWPQAEKLGKKPCDPLAEDLLTSLTDNRH
jgi:hypothetical protein